MEEENLNATLYRANDDAAAPVTEDDPSHIVTTSDIDNYFNLQITTQLFFGSNQEPHDLILDTGSMVRNSTLFDKALCFSLLVISLSLVDLGLDQRLLELWNP